MSGAPSVPDPARVPGDFDELVEWLDGWSERLVLLEAYPLPDLRRAIDGVRGAVRTHVRALDARLATVARPGRASEVRSLLRADHAWFATSLEQFDWSLGIVEREDHGGHRQALGQYGRLLAEALRRHRRLEREYLGPGDTREAPRSASAPARKP